MATQPRLVNKQFNSPIGLYSEQNVREVIEREKQILGNGAVGVDFYNTNVGKPANLQNSAVLRMLEEEEHRQRSGRAGNEYVPRPLQDLAWPPPMYDQKNQLRSTFKDVVIPGVKRVAWPPPQEGVLEHEQAVEQQAVHAQGGPQYSSPGLQQNNYSQTASQYQQQQQQSYQSSQQYHQTSQQSYQPARSPLKPLDVTSKASASPLTSPLVNQSPTGFRPTTPSRQWAPVHSPVQTPQNQQFQAPGQHYQSTDISQQYQPQYQSSVQQYQTPGQQQFQSPTQQYQSPGQQYQSSVQQYQSPGAGSQFQTPPSQSQQFPKPVQPVAAQSQATPKTPSSKPVEPPPSVITLRPQAPVSQAPPPVFSSQPATATLKGGKHLRGDLKWPPEDVRKRFAEEDRMRIELATGPANRPKRLDKDYTPFFEAHALNSSYPGYKIPPGTQFYRPQ